MRIYNRKDFMELPPGTIYAKGVEWNFTELCVKGETLRNDLGEDIDWTAIDLINNGLPIDTNEHRELGISYYLDDAGGSDGCFSDDDVFVVYEKPDLRYLAQIIDTALSVSDDPNL